MIEDVLNGGVCLVIGGLDVAGGLLRLLRLPIEEAARQRPAQAFVE